MRKPQKKGIITIAFDDAYLSTCKHALKYLDRRNVKSTIAIPSNFIGKTFEKRPTVGIKDLKRAINSGHEIASHTLTHPNLFRLNSKDRSKATDEISMSKKKLVSLLGYHVSSFVFPYINKNQSVLLRRKTRSFYKSARITSNNSCFNKIPIRDPYSITGFAVTKKHSVSYLNKLVYRAEEKNLWLIEVFHLVGTKNTLSAHRPKPYRFFTHINDFKKHIDYILSKKDITILTQETAIKKYAL